MWFDGKLVKDISSKEIEMLVNGQAAEDEGIDFKAEPYGGTNATDAKKCELCCDVTSFANAAGGYIVLGIRDKNDRASDWAFISEPEPHIERIRKTCLDGIEPRISDLDVGAINVAKQGKVIVIRIPDGIGKPYMVRQGRNTHFCCRYADGKREMSYVEIRDSFRNDWADQRMTRLEAKMDGLITRSSTSESPVLGAETDTLTILNPKDLERIMEARLRKVAEE